MKINGDELFMLPSDETIGCLCGEYEEFSVTFAEGE
jgi:hypothetical protein